MNLGEPNVEQLEYRVALRKKFKKRLDSAPCPDLLNALFDDSYQQLKEQEETSVRFLEFYNKHRDEQGNFKPKVSDCINGIFDYGIYLLKRRLKV
jgi:hypothetical protein